MKIDVELPDDFAAWLEQQPLSSELAGSPLSEKLRFLLQDEIDFFHQCREEERHKALLRLLGVEHLIDAGGPDADDDLPF